MPAQLAPPLKLKVNYARDPSGTGFFWPESAEKRDEVLSVARNAPAVFEAVYQGRPGQREGSIFLSTDLDNFYSVGEPPLPLSLGLSNPAVANFCSRGHAVIQAWDTAFSSSSQAAYTVCVTALLVPCTSYHCNEDPTIFGPCEFHFDVFILDIFRARVDWGGLVSKARELYYRWKPLEVVIEKKASGISLIQSLKSVGLPIIEAAADESKGQRAVNSVGLKGAGSAQGWFRQHRVLVPNQPLEWLLKWRTEMRDFSGEDDASSDQVDATVHAVRRAIVMGSTSAVLPSEWTPERSAIPDPVIAARDAAEALANNPDPRAQILASIVMLPSMVVDEAFGLCTSCNNFTNGYCSLHKRKTLTLDSCEFYLNAEDAKRDFTSAASNAELFRGQAGSFPFR